MLGKFHIAGTLECFLAKFCASLGKNINDFLNKNIDKNKRDKPDDFLGIC